MQNGEKRFKLPGRDVLERDVLDGIDSIKKSSRQLRWLTDEWMDRDAVQHVFDLRASAQS